MFLRIIPLDFLVPSMDRREKVIHLLRNFAPKSHPEKQIKLSDRENEILINYLKRFGL